MDGVLVPDPGPRNLGGRDKLKNVFEAALVYKPL